MSSSRVLDTYRWLEIILCLSKTITLKATTVSFAFVGSSGAIASEPMTAKRAAVFFVVFVRCRI